MNVTTKNRDIGNYYINCPKELIDDNSISSHAFHMMMIIMSDSDNFKIYLKNLANRMNVSYRTAQRYMKELENANYVIKKNKEGKWYYNISLKPFNTPKSKYTSYQDYLAYPEWKEKRKRIKERDNFKCVKCGSQKELQVHHIIYIEDKKPWEYNDNLLITLCDECHKDVHNIN